MYFYNMMICTMVLCGQSMKPRGRTLKPRFRTLKTLRRRLDGVPGSLGAAGSAELTGDSLEAAQAMYSDLFLKMADDQDAWKAYIDSLKNGSGRKRKKLAKYLEDSAAAVQKDMYDSKKGLPSTIADARKAIQESKAYKKKFEAICDGVLKADLAQWIADPPLVEVLDIVKKDKKLKQDFNCLKDLYEECKKTKNQKEFKNALKGLEKKIRVKGFQFKMSIANMKQLVRACYKFMYKYNRDASELTDILRASFTFDKLSDMKEALKILGDEEVQKELGYRLVRIKDRIREPTPAGYRDVLTNIKLRKSGLIVEVQFHQTDLYEEKKGSHQIYKDARHFPTFDDHAYKVSTKNGNTINRLRQEERVGAWLSAVRE